MTVKSSERWAPRLFPLVVGALAFALAGCAGGASETDAPAAGDQVEAPAEAETDASGEGGDGGTAGADLGSITVGTTTYDVVEAVNCEPVQTNDLTTEVFNSIAIAQSAAGEEVLFFAYSQEQSGARANFVDYQGPEGTLSTQQTEATFTFEGGVLSGAAVLVDDAATESFMAQFTFDLPEELVTC